MDEAASKMDGKDGATATMLPSGRPPQTTEGAKTPQYLITLAVTLVAFGAGNVIGWSSPALSYLQAKNSTLTITSHEASWVGSLVAVGAFIGAFPAGPIADIWGRKLTLLSLAAPLLISWVMIFFASSVYLIYLARLIAGFGIGAVCAVVPMYISEIAEPSIRGVLGSAFQFMLVCGVLYTFIMGALVSYGMLSLVNGIIPIIFVVAFFKAPETPVFLLKKDQRTNAENALLSLRGQNYNVIKELQSLENEISQQSGNSTNLMRTLLKRASIMSLIICLGLMTFQQLSGINIVIFYTKNIFEDAGSTLDPDLATIFVGFTQVIATIIAGILIDRLGRKMLLAISAAIMSMCLFILGWYFHVKDKCDNVSVFNLIPLVSVIVYILVFAVGFGPIPWMMTGELLPTEIKGVGTGLAVALNWGLAFGVTKTYHLMNEALGLAQTYWIFGGICIIGFFFSTFVVIETKGKTLAEIQNELSGNKTEQRRNHVI